MKTDCIGIIMALNGQDEFLRRLFDSKDKPPEPQELPPLTPAALLSTGRVLRPPPA